MLFVLELVFPGICMGDQDPAEAIRNLTTAIRDLSIAISSHPQGDSVPPSSLSDGEWSVVGEESEDFRVRDDIECRSAGLRSAEEGPGPTPEVLLRFAETRLSSKPPGAEARVRRAFVAGFWARIAIATHTKYQPVDPLPGFKIAHWVVLQSRSIEGRAWFTSKSDFNRAVAPDPSECVFEAFSSQTEIEIFCAGASVPVPALKTWKSQVSSSSRMETPVSLSGAHHRRR